MAEQNDNPVVGKICVHAKMQNRTALGIMHAYLSINPQATLEELREAFPNSLNPDKGVDEIFVLDSIKGTNPNWNGYFFEDCSYLHLNNGSKIAVVSMWTKSSLENLKTHAAQYGITSFKEESNDFTKNKSKFSLEYLHGYVPPVLVDTPQTASTSSKKKSNNIFILTIIILVLLLILFLLLYN